jgi:hypothetical protein
MRRARKLTGVLALLALCACATNQGTPTTGTTGTTSGTPDSTGASGTGKQNVDCSAVRCATCPEGQHPALTPPDCCGCIPD